MPVDALTGLIDAIRQSRLLEPAQAGEFARFQATFPEPRALAAELIRRGWLTPYQINQLMRGRGPELLLGSYVLLERIGEGGMGAVFKARNWKLGQVVALKLIRKERLVNPDAVRRFHREIRAAAQLDHANIVRALDADEVGGTHLLIMEYVQGTDLSKLVKKDGPQAVDKACDYCRQAALGLQHACERGLVHRDIKPHNLLLTPAGVVKILDMGLARLDRTADDEGSSTMTREGAVMGTLDYISPEQAMDSHDVDVRADLYSLGCTLYFLLTGKVPFPGGEALQKLLKHRLDEPVPVEQRRPNVPPGVAAVVRKLMAKQPEDRYQTPAEASAALAAAVQAKACPAAPAVMGAGVTSDTTAGWSSMVVAGSLDQTVAMPQRRRRQAPRRPWVWLGAAIGVVVLGLGLTGLFRLLPRGSNPPSQDATPPSSGAPLAAPTDITNSIGMKLKLIKPGTFAMGSPKEEEGRLDDEGPQHEVEITKAFYMGVYPVTKGQFAAFVQDSGYQTDAEKDGRGGFGLNLATAGWELRPEYTWRHPGFPQGDDHPVVEVSWNGATAFCAWLSKKEGKTYELPTEAEWEYACRAGTKTRFWFGDKYEDLKGNANIADASLIARCPGLNWAGAWVDGYAFTSPVGSFKANPWGLYDMHGNVWQWCADGYEKFQEGSIKDPKGKEDSNGHVWRGGCWGAAPSHCRSACRGAFNPEVRGVGDGFRVVMRPAPSAGSARAVDDAWLKQVAALPAEKQVEAVAAKLKELNPGFDGKATPKIEKGVVTGLEFCTDDVTDIAPVRALPALKSLNCNGSAAGKGRLWNLSPLKGMKLAGLGCGANPVFDLSPLKGIPLTFLACNNTNVIDLSPLKGMPLAELNCNATKVRELSPLKDMKLEFLGCSGTGVSDLSPLIGMPLDHLQCGSTPVFDLSPLTGMPLTRLSCDYAKVGGLSPLKDMKLTLLGCSGTPVSDLSPLKGMPLTRLGCASTRIADLSPLKGMPLVYLDCRDTSVTDQSPLKEMPLKELWCDFKPDRDAELLRSIKTLEKINDKPAAEVLK